MKYFTILIVLFISFAENLFSNDTLFSMSIGYKKLTGSLMHPDGKSFLSISNNKVVNFWDLETKKVYKQYFNDSLYFKSFKYSPDGSILVNISGDSISIIDPITFKVLKSIKSYYVFSNFKTNNFAISNDNKYIILTYNAALLVCNIETGEFKSKNLNLGSDLSYAKSNANGSKFFVQFNKSAKIINLDSLTIDYTFFTPNNSGILSIDINDDFTKIAYATDLGEFGVWNIQNNVKERSINNQYFCSIKYSIDGNKIFAGNQYGYIKIFKSNDLMLPLSKEFSKNDSITSIIEIPSSNKLICTSINGVIKEYNFSNLKFIGEYFGHFPDLITSDYSIKKNVLATLYSDQRLIFWNLNDLSHKQIFLSDENKYIKYLYLSDDLSYFNTNNSLYVSTYDSIGNLLYNKENFSHQDKMKFTPDKKLFYWDDFYSVINYYDRYNLEFVRKDSIKRRYSPEFNTIDFKNNRLFTANPEKYGLEVWDLNTGDSIKSIVFSNYTIQDVYILPKSDKFLVFDYWKHQYYLLDKNYQIIIIYYDINGPIKVISNNEKYFVIGDYGFNIYSLDKANYKYMYKFPSDFTLEYIKGLYFSEDDQTIILTSSNGEIAIFNFRLVSDINNDDYKLDNNYLEIYPNPALDKIRIVNSNPDELFSIFDINGNLIQNNISIINKDYIDVSNLKIGMYFLVSKYKTIKFIKI